MTPDLVILRSPSGQFLTVGEGGLRSPDGRTYRFEKGVAFLYDDADVSPFLTHDSPIFQLSHDRPEVTKHAAWDAIQASYARARAINTDFLFTVLRYADPSQRRVVEIGVGACDIIRRFSRLGMQTFAVDYFPWEMQSALAAAQAAGEPGFHCVSAPMARLPFADASVDLVYFHAALHHALPRDAADFRWSDPINLHDCLSEVRRILKPRAEGGVFFLLGEGIYPEHFTPAERPHEVLVQANPDAVYESWYKISEYEQAYQAAGIYPNLFVWQESYILQAFGYSADGTRIEIVVPSDAVSDGNYWKMSPALTRHANALLPSWIGVADLADPFLPALGDGLNVLEVLTSMHTVVGRPTHLNGVPVFVADPGAEGYLLYGPYSELAAGAYEAKFAFRLQAGGAGGILSFDVIGSAGPLCAPTIIELAGITEDTWHRVTLTFEAHTDVTQLETRALIAGGASSAVSVAAAAALCKR